MKTPECPKMEPRRPLDDDKPNEYLESDHDFAGHNQEWLEWCELHARLIAAAPELLEALENVLRYCVTPKGMPDKDKGRSIEQQAALDNALAAIRKATTPDTKEVRA